MLRVFKAAVVAASLLSASAQATLFDFSYSYSSSIGGPDGVISGRIDGILQSNNNDVLVNSIVGQVQFNGVDAGVLPFTNSVTGFFQSPTVVQPAFVTLDGVRMNFIACTSNACFDGFIFNHDPLRFPVTFSSGASFGNASEPYSARGWSMSAVTGGVPEPASWAMLIAGFGLVGTVLRRRNAIAA